MADHHYLDFFFHEEDRQTQEQDEEEALSLCDLPLNDALANRKYNTLDDRMSRRSSFSEAADFFEFFNDTTFDMCPADDIIFCGKLVPFKDTHQSPPYKYVKDPNKPPALRRRSESLSQLQSAVTRSNSASTCGNSRRFMMRNSRSLDYRRLHRSSSSVALKAPEIERNPSARSVVQSEIAVKKAMKPRWWYSLMFGIVKIPPEMELNDIKSRQFRRNTSTTMFPTTDGNGKVAVNRSSGKVSWKILKALSCKDYTSVSVTTSFVVPQAS